MTRAQLLAAGSNWVAFAATLAVSFLLTPVLLRGLGDARYGVWCYAESLLAFFMLLDMGLAAGLVRGVARHRAMDAMEPLNRLASSTLALLIAGGLAALAVGLPLMLVLTPALGQQTGDPADVRSFLLLMLGNLAISLPLSIYPSVLDGLERYGAKSLVRLGCLAVRTAAVVAVFRLHASLVPLAVVFTVVNLLEHVLLALLVHRLLPGLRLQLQSVDRASLREIRRFSAHALLAMLAGRVAVQGGVVMVGLLLPMGQVAAFATALRLVEYAKTLLRTITATLTPGISAREARGDWVGISQLFQSATRLVLYLVLPVQIGLWQFGGPFLERWVPSIAEAAKPALWILAVVLTASVVQSVASRLLYGLGRLRWFARLALAEAALVLLLLAALIPALGLAGAAIATALPHVLFCLGVLAHALPLARISVRDYVALWWKPMLAAAGPLVLWNLWPSPAGGWWPLAATIFAGVSLHTTLAVLLECRLPRRHIPAIFARLGPRRPRWSNRR